MPQEKQMLFHRMPKVKDTETSLRWDHIYDCQDSPDITTQTCQRITSDLWSSGSARRDTAEKASLNSSISSLNWELNCTSWEAEETSSLLS